jgi:hypothetical protein
MDALRRVFRLIQLSESKSAMLLGHFGEYPGGILRFMRYFTCEVRRFQTAEDEARQDPQHIILFSKFPVRA